jgi:hypothetical protein
VKNPGQQRWDKQGYSAFIVGGSEWLLKRIPSKVRVRYNEFRRRWEIRRVEARVEWFGRTGNWTGSYTDIDPIAYLTVPRQRTPRPNLKNSKARKACKEKRDEIHPVGQEVGQRRHPAHLRSPRS